MQGAACGSNPQPFGERLTNIQTGAHAQFAEDERRFTLPLAPAFPEAITFDKYIVGLGATIVRGKINIAGGSRYWHVALPVELGSGQGSPDFLSGIDQENVVFSTIREGEGIKASRPR